MHAPLQHAGEPNSNSARRDLGAAEPVALRTFTPTQAVLAASAGVYHWTPDGKKLYDYTSGVLVSNLGHNPLRWTERFFRHMGYPPTPPLVPAGDVPAGYFAATAMTAYNAVTPVEVEASRALLEVLRRTPGGQRLDRVMWAASGSEAIQKALWASMARDKTRPLILATRFGFHGKKGLANAVTGSERDAERDPRVRFFGFPMHECDDVDTRGADFDPAPYRQQLVDLARSAGTRIGTLITEPYLGGGGSYHPNPAYLKVCQDFCREHDVVFILDEVQANFGRTRELFAFEAYGLEPDIVVLGKGLGNGVPVAAAVGRRDVFDALTYGEASDTWSANPLCCAAVLATLEEFADGSVMAHARDVSRIIESGLVGLKEFPFVARVRGEDAGMVWGVEFQDFADKSAADWANAFVLAAYHGRGEVGVHLLGPLAKKVVRVSPPLVISHAEARDSLAILRDACERLAEAREITASRGSGLVGAT